MSDDAFDEDITEPSAEGNESGVSLEDFVMIKPTHTYIFVPCREPWVPSSINALFPPVPVLDKNGKPKRGPNGKIITIRPTTSIDRERSFEQMVWAPGFPLRVADRLLVDGGWIKRKDVAGFNLYQPPRIEPGDASQAGVWLEHVHKIYPDEAERIVRWCAHRVQRPGEKINHALVIGGKQEIGKDTMLEALKYAVGHRNFHEIGPTDLLDKFNEYARSVVLRISEAHDLGETNRFAFYDHIKRYTVTPPGEIRVNEKHLRAYYILNCMGIIITTNHKTDGLFLPADDRRHFVAWSTCTTKDFPAGYWKRIWDWYHGGGFEHVAAYLTELDLSQFDPKAPPPKTPAFWDIVNANHLPEDSELMDALDALGNPDAVIIPQLIAKAPGDVAEWLTAHKNRKAIPHSDGALRLRRGPRSFRRAMEDQGQALHDLRQGRAARRRLPARRPQAPGDPNMKIKVQPEETLEARESRREELCWWLGWMMARGCLVCGSQRAGCPSLAAATQEPSSICPELERALAPVFRERRQRR